MGRRMGVSIDMPIDMPIAVSIRVSIDMPIAISIVVSIYMPIAVSMKGFWPLMVSGGGRAPFCGRGGFHFVESHLPLSSLSSWVAFSLIPASVREESSAA